MKYTDPDGKLILPTKLIVGNNFFQQDSNRTIGASLTSVAKEGCYATANARVINAINAIAKARDSSLNALQPVGVDFTISQNEFFDYDRLDVNSTGRMINKFTIFETSTKRVVGTNRITETLLKYSNSRTEHAAIVGKINVAGGSHFLNIEGIRTDSNGNITSVDVYDTSTTNRLSLTVTEFIAIEITTWKIPGSE